MMVSMHIDKKMSQNHNRRSYGSEDGHIHVERSHENITLVDDDLGTVLRNALRDPVETFNSKQRGKHPERIKDLSEVVKEGRTHAREMIVQVGNVDDQLSLEEYKDMYTELLDDFREQFPHLVIFGAYIHMDESTPHMHLDFIPIADSSRGISKKVSLDGALKCDGFPGKKGDMSRTPFKDWTDQYRNDLEDMIMHAGYDIQKHQKRTKEHSTKHVQYYEYKEKRAKEKYHAAVQLIDDVQKSLDEVIDYPYSTMKDVEEMKDRLRKSREKLDEIKDEIETAGTAGLAPKTYEVDQDQGEKEKEEDDLSFFFDR